MTEFKVVPLDEAYAIEIRNKMEDEYGHELQITQSPSDNNNPCRLCL